MNQKDFQKISSAALAMTMAATMVIPSFADMGACYDPNSPTSPSGVQTYVNMENHSFEDSDDTIIPPAGNEQQTVSKCTVAYTMRTGDRGELDFYWAKTKNRQTLGSDNVPRVTLPNGWYLDGYYIDGQKYTAYDLAGYEITSPTLEIEVRTYPSEMNSGSDDRNEVYGVNFMLRDGDRGTLTNDYITVTGHGKKIPYKDIPVLTDRSAKNRKIKGYYINDEKYTRSELAKLPIEEDLDIEVRTYRKDDENVDHSSGWDGNEYDWGNDIGSNSSHNNCISNPVFDPFNSQYQPPVQNQQVQTQQNSTFDPFNSQSSKPSYVIPQNQSPAQQVIMVLAPQNGQAPMSYSVQAGKPIMAPVDPKCPGFNFAGWSTSKDGKSGLYDFRTGLTQNTVLYGVWTKAQTTTPEYGYISNYNPSNGVSGNITVINTSNKGYHNVTLKPRNGKYYNPVPVKDGNKIRIEGQPTRKGYRFVGWATDKDGDEMWDFNTSVDEDISLYAVWEER